MTFRDRNILRIKLISTSDPEKSYFIEVIRDPKTVKCDCIGFNVHGRCKHIKFYYGLIRQFLHKNPDDIDEKWC